MRRIYIHINIILLLFLLIQLSWGQTDSLNISWDRNSSTNDSLVEYYRLLVASSTQDTIFDDSDYTFIKRIEQTFPGIDPSTSDTNSSYIQPGFYLSYRVVAVDSNGLSSPPSDRTLRSDIGLPLINWTYQYLFADSSNLFELDTIISDWDHPFDSLTTLIPNDSIDPNLQITFNSDSSIMTLSPLVDTGQVSFWMKVRDPDGFYDEKEILFYISETLPDTTIAEDDDVGDILQGSLPVSIDVLANDYTNYPPLTISGIVDSANYGTTQINSTFIVYHPEPTNIEPDTFQYEITNGIGFKDSAYVFITIIPKPDTTRLGDDTQVINQGSTSISIYVLENDSTNYPPLTIIGISDSARHGNTQIYSNYIVYDPDENNAEPDTFQYEVINGINNVYSAWVYISINTVTANQ